MNAYFVVGLEGSGTYMLAEALVSAGCRYNDDYKKVIIADKVVVRISEPHAGKFITVDELISPYRDFDIHILVIFRDLCASRASVIRRDPTRTIDETEYKLGKLHVGEFLKHPNSIHVNYGAFVREEKYRKWLFNSIGLRAPKGEFYDASSKYYR